MHVNMVEARIRSVCVCRLVSGGPSGDNKDEMTEFRLLVRCDGAMNLEMGTTKDPGLAWQALNETGSCDSLSRSE